MHLRSTLSTRLIAAEEVDGDDDAAEDACCIETLSRDEDVAIIERDEDIVGDVRQVKIFYDQDSARCDEKVVDDDHEMVRNVNRVSPFSDQKNGGMYAFDEGEDSEIIRDTRKVETFYCNKHSADEGCDENDRTVEGASNVCCSTPRQNLWMTGPTMREVLVRRWWKMKMRANTKRPWQFTQCATHQLAREEQMANETIDNAHNSWNQCLCTL